MCEVSTRKHLLNHWFFAHIVRVCVCVSEYVRAHAYVCICMCLIVCVFVDGCFGVIDTHMAIMDRNLNDSLISGSLLWTDGRREKWNPTQNFERKQHGRQSLDVFIINWRSVISRRHHISVFSGFSATPTKCFSHILKMGRKKENIFLLIAE